MVDVDTIGAGGGSIAYVDQGGIFRVGPRSAGAVPGPAAYNRGGTEATATDALVNLGWLRRRRSSAAAWSSTPELARKAFEDGPAAALGMTVEEASMGAVQILTHSMVQSIEENSVRKGYDPRDFALVAEGGAGPLFAAQIALEVGTPTVVVPPYPGIAAAMGLLATDMVYEYVATTYQRLSRLDAPALAARVRGARGLARRAARGGRDRPGQRRRPANRRVPLPRPGLRAPRRRALGRDRRRVGREGAGRLPRHPRAGVLAPLRGVGHRDPEHPRPRDRPDAARCGRPRSSRATTRRTRRCGTRASAWFRVGGGLQAGADPVLRARGAEGRQPARRAGDRHAVRLDHGDPARPRGARRPLREHRDRDRRAAGAQPETTELEVAA